MIRSRSPFATTLLVGFVLACSSEPEPQPGSSSSAGSAGAGGLPVAGSAGGAGAAGGPSAGSGGQGGSAGQESGGSGGTEVTVGTTGVQADPGAEGDGEYPQPDTDGVYPAPPEATHLPDTPVGTVQGHFLFESTTVYPGLKYRYWIYVPSQYQPGKPAALMVFQDGSHYLGYTEASFNSLAVFDNLIHAGDMPVTIGVFIENGTFTGAPYNHNDSAQRENRSMQYDTPSDQYSEFLLTEFLPNTILNQYDIVQDPDGWGIGGHSSGGICAFMTGWYRPDKFRKLLTHNASFPNTDGVFPAAIDTAAAKPLRVYLLSSPNDIGGWFEANNAAADALEAKGYHYRYRSGTGIHYPPTQAEADYPDALRWMWRGYSLPWYD